MQKLLLAIGLLCGLSLSAMADVPKTINFQGQITDVNDQPIADGEHVAQFRLYDCAAGGIALWQENQDITTENGYFAIALGDVEELGADIFGEPLWVGIKIGTGDEMMPRVQLKSTPYAMTVADDTVSTATIKNGTIKDEDMAQGVGVPVGAIIIWRGDECPCGYKKVTEFGGRFLKDAGADAVGNTGGSYAHYHNMSGTALPTVADGTAVQQTASGAWVIEPTHTHEVTGATDAQEHMPPYVSVTFCEKCAE